MTKKDTTIKSENAFLQREKEIDKRDAVRKADFEDFEKEQASRWKDQDFQHAKISADEEDIKKHIKEIKTKLDEIYPKVKQDLQVSEAVKILNKYGQSKVGGWVFWFKVLGLIGAALATIAYIKSQVIFFIHK